jgi:hypothetical protein
MSLETRNACHRSFSDVVTWRDVTWRALLSDFESRGRCTGREETDDGSMAAACSVGHHDVSGRSLWGAADPSPGMCAVNDFWEDIYLYQDIVLRRIAVGSWRYFRLQLPHVTGCCSTCQSCLMPLCWSHPLHLQSAWLLAVLDCSFGCGLRFGCGRSLVESVFIHLAPTLWEGQSANGCVRQGRVWSVNCDDTSIEVR